MSDPITSNEECAICTNQISRVAIIQPCQHKFDYRCIKRWFKERPRELSCPVCRKKTTSIIYDVQADASYEEEHARPNTRRPARTNYGPMAMQLNGLLRRAMRQGDYELGRN